MAPVGSEGRTRTRTRTTRTRTTSTTTTKKKKKVVEGGVRLGRSTEEEVGVEYWGKEFWSAMV